jgi:nitroreductase
MSVLEVIQKRRTIRRFKQDLIPYEMIVKLVDAARLAPSASNLQPLEYIIVDDKIKVRELFQYTGWAGYLPAEIGRPKQEQCPTAFIVILLNTAIGTKWVGHDIGASTENMILTALEMGIGTCWIGSVDREKVRVLFTIPNQYEINCVLALGIPDEDQISEPLHESIQYFRDASDRLHVPKRRLQDILHQNNFK